MTGLLRQEQTLPMPPRGWSRKKLLPGLPVVLVTVGAVLFGLLAWREANRAGGTAEVLMKDYASFIAERLVRQAAERFRTLMGPSREGREAVDSSALGLLLNHAQSMASGVSAELPVPDRPYIRYFFSYDAAAGNLQIRGKNVTDADRETLETALRALSPRCAGRRLVAFGSLGNLDPDFEPGERLGVDWSGWIHTSETGGVRYLCGALLDYEQAVEAFIVPLITGADDCGCPTRLLPESLDHIPDARHAASFAVRDGRGEIRYRSEPLYESSPSVVHSLSMEMPFPGWTVEVAVNPAVVQPLLPYGGKGVPWLILTLLFLLVVTSGGLAVRSLRRSSELIRIQQDFVGNVSHELKTPLARIRLFNELLSAGAGADSNKSSHYRKVIDRECRRLSFLVNNVLDFSRRRRNGPEFGRSELDLRRVIDEGLEAFRSLSDQGRFTLTEHLDEVPRVLGDEYALQQVLINLLDNAVKYSPEGGSVEVRLTADDGVAILSVKDRGYGIPESEQTRIFDEFYRLDSGEAQRGSGSGLGLALVKHTVEAHGGRVRVLSHVGQGSVFLVEIPTVARGGVESARAGAKVEG